jgi:hypothetical protein
VPIAEPIAEPIAGPIVAPIVAVSVYPDRARITRRGTARLAAGDQVVSVEPLPPGPHPDSVRVSGRGPATVATRPATVTVLDQLPVARDHEITVKPLELRPEPVEHTDLGVLTWKLELAPGAEQEIHFGVRVETGKNVELAGWRD